jgi:hypothetical protein
MPFLRLAMLQVTSVPCGVILKRFFATPPLADIGDSIKEFDEEHQSYSCQFLEMKECLLPSM